MLKRQDSDDSSEGLNATMRQRASKSSPRQQSLPMSFQEKILSAKSRIA